MQLNIQSGLTTGTSTYGKTPAELPDVAFE